MRILRIIVALVLATTMLAGCGTLKKFTGQRNDTVLPGEREDILPEDQQRNPKLGKADDLAACDPTVDLNCEQPIDQEAQAPEDIQ